MAIQRVQSPFAANLRAIKRMERLEQEAKRVRSRRERLEAEDRAIARRERGRKRAERSEAALRADNERRFKEDLRDSILRGRPVGLLRKVKPSINKVVVHTRGPGGEMALEPQMESHLRGLAAKSNALNMLVTGQGTAELRAGSDLAPDFYPQNFFTGTGAPPQGFGPSTMPDQISGGPYDPAGDIRGGQNVPPMQGQLPADLDLTSLYQTPEFEQGPPSETKMQHIYKMLDMMQGRKTSTIEDKVEQLRSSGARSGLSPRETETMVQRSLGGLEKPTGGGGKISDADLVRMFGGGKLDEGTQELLKELRPEGAARPAGRPGAPAPPQLTKEQIRADFMEEWGVEPTSIEIFGDQAVIWVGPKNQPGSKRFVIDRGENA